MYSGSKRKARSRRAILRKTRPRNVIVAAASATLLVQGSTPAALAFDPPYWPGPCKVAQAQYFPINDPMLSSKSPWWRDGVNWFDTVFLPAAAVWDAWKSPTGQPITVASRGNPGYSIDVSMQPIKDPNVLGYTSCEPWVSLFGGVFGQPNTLVMSNTLTIDRFRSVASHEVGHIHGLRHTGNFESWGFDNPSIMSTCLSDGTPLSLKPSQDDVANLMSAWAPHSLIANQSFENGTQFWRSEFANLEYRTQGGTDGPGSLKITRTSSTTMGRIYQRQRVSQRYWLRARANYKDADTRVSGTMRLRLTARPVGFEGEKSGTCEYKQFTPGLNRNKPDTSVGTFTFNKIVESIIPVGDNWNYSDSDRVYIPADWAATDVEVAAYKDTLNGPLYLDNVRAWWEA